MLMQTAKILKEVLVVHVKLDIQEMGFLVKVLLIFSKNQI